MKAAVSEVLCDPCLVNAIYQDATGRRTSLFLVLSRLVALGENQATGEFLDVFQLIFVKSKSPFAWPHTQ